MADITMPQLGETVTEGTITKWFKAVGDDIAEDETLFEVSTDKVDSEVPSSVSGVVAEILVQEGETVDVGARLAVIAEEGGPAAEGGEPSGGAGAQAGPPTDGRNGANGPSADEHPAGAASAPEVQEDQAPARAPAEAAAPAPKARPAIAPATRAAAVTPASDRARGNSGAGAAPQLLSPIVRRLLAEHGVDPSSIKGTGRGGRVTRDDVLVHVAAGPSNTSGAGTSTSPARSATVATASPMPRGEGDEVIPFSNIRRRTAEHMIRSQATSAHVLTVIEVDYERVDRVRRAEREQWKEEEGFSLTYLPFVSRAVIDAIRDFPHVNASVGDDALIVHRQVHLGFAVDLNFEGLIVPVIHDADTKRLRTLAREVADLAARARSRSINADEISGSTFTITNPGSFGTFITAPVINQPQVAIVSSDGVRKRPVVIELPDGSDGIAIHPVGNLAMSFDHRAFDGAYASAFLARCRDIIETRDWSQEL